MSVKTRSSKFSYFGIVIVVPQIFSGVIKTGCCRRCMRARSLLSRIHMPPWTKMLAWLNESSRWANRSCSTSSVECATISDEHHFLISRQNRPFARAVKRISAFTFRDTHLRIILLESPLVVLRINVATAHPGVLRGPPRKKRCCRSAPTFQR